MSTLEKTLANFTGKNPDMSSKFLTPVTYQKYASLSKSNSITAGLIHYILYCVYHQNCFLW